MNRTRKISGFTLIEILIVVIILGILAAIVIPQFTNASTEAKESSLASQLQTLRSQIGLYKLQHGDTPPASSSFTDAGFWTALTTQTDDKGTAFASGDGQGPFGPYFTTAVTNPLMNTAVDTAGYGTVDNSGTASSTTAWEYNPATGEIHGVMPTSPGASTYQITDDGVTAASWSSAPSSGS